MLASAAPKRAKEILASRPVLQPQQHAKPFAYEGPGWGARCGGPSDNDVAKDDASVTHDKDWDASQVRLQDLERSTGLIFIQRVRLRRQLEAGCIVDPPIFFFRFGGVPYWLRPPSPVSSPRSRNSPACSSTELVFVQPPRPAMSSEGFRLSDKRPALPLGAPPPRSPWKLRHQPVWAAASCATGSCSGAAPGTFSALLLAADFRGSRRGLSETLGSFKGSGRGD